MAGVVDWLHELRDPACYPDRPDHVELVQTHISVVCLAGDRVYKLKKALRLPFLDCSTAAQREFFCHEELRLNRRLCPAVYLDVVPLVRTPDGLRFGAPGTPIEHAVQMRRLPRERMLDELLRLGQVGAAEITRLAAVIADFHARCEHGPGVTAAGAPEQLRALALANFTELQALQDHGLDAALLAALATRTHADFAALLPLLERRAAEGRIVDGHGDLHARNICLTEPPAVYDCIEFSAAFRCGDVATENAFLCMDLRYRGNRALADAYAQAYAAHSSDHGQLALLPMLLRYRAMVRAKVATMAAAEPELPAGDRAGARSSAQAHVQLAAVSAIEQHGPLWLLVCGVPGSGKSALGGELARRSDWPLFATDPLRKELAGLPATARAGNEQYTQQRSDRVYGELLRRAAAAFAPVVLLDGNFPDPSRRAQALAAARARGARLLVAQLEVPDAVALERLRQRATADTDASDAGPAQFAALRTRFVPPAAGEGFAVVRVAAAGALATTVDALLVALLRTLAADRDQSS
ncbi:MAG TPA: AAA family ATPase [Planctomycetota bacterium]|nr:AAA family ATPase [Planctomycetota bacterium]